MPRIILIHATPIAVEPIRRAFALDWPQAEALGVLDETLAVDRAKTPDLTPGLSARILALADHAIACGAQAILYTCSAFGPAIEEAARRHPAPVLKPNEAMFEAALAQGERIAMIYTFPPAAASMEAEFCEAARRAGSKARLTSVLAPGALEAARAGDIAGHDRIVAQTAARLPACDAIMLAHFSTATALEAVRALADPPVLSSPAAAVARLRARFEL